MEPERVGMIVLEPIYENLRIMVVLSLLCVGGAVAFAAESAGTSSLVTRTPTAASVQIPAYFERNEGQFPTAVRFVARMSGYAAQFTDRDVVFSVGDRTHATKVHMQLVAGGGELQPGSRLPGKVNYFIGSDPAKWHRGVATYDQIVRQYAYPGIDVVYRIAGSELEYDLVVSPGADPNRIALDFTGAKGLRLDKAGDLVVATAAGEIRQRKPNVFQEGDGNRKPLEGHFVLQSRNTVGFVVAAYDASKRLIIDPAITYSTYLGGTSSSIGNSVAVYTDPVTGHAYAYMAGGTCDTDFPTKNALQNAPGGSGCLAFIGEPAADAFVAKFDASASGAASLLWSTYIGGSDNEEYASAIAVDSAGNAYITGNTNSIDFPAVNAFRASLHPDPADNYPYKAPDAFVAKLSADGSTLLYSTYFGGSGWENSHAIGLDSTGRVYIAGATTSTDLPTLNPYQATLRTTGPTGSTFLAIFDPERSGQGSLLYSTYLGGSGNNYYGDVALTLAVDTAGNAHLGGYATSHDFPIANGFQTSFLESVLPGMSFYAKINPFAIGASQLVYSTYVGVAGGSSGLSGVTGVAVDSSGNAYVTGNSVDGLAPITTGAYHGTTYRSASAVALVAKINPLQSGASSLVYCASLPITGAAGATAIAVDASGDAFILGDTGDGFPLVNQTQNSSNGVLQSLDGGNGWIGLNNGISDATGFGPGISSLAIDASSSPRTLYAGSLQGSLYRSSDGGLNWNVGLQVPNNGSYFCSIVHSGYPYGCVFSLVIDPANPSTVYAGTSAGVYRSTDRGGTWNLLNDGLPAAQDVAGLKFDKGGFYDGTLYAGTEAGLFKLAPGSSTWTATSLTAPVSVIAIDSNTNPHTIYTGADLEDYTGHKSTDGGNTWVAVNALNFNNGYCCSFFAVDTATSPSTLYSATYDEGTVYLLTSTDGGSTWTAVAPVFPTLDENSFAGTIVLDSTRRPTIVYAKTPNGGLAKTLDGGTTWINVIGDHAASLAGLAVDETTATPTSPAALYVGTGYSNVENFVAELNPSGSALLFSTYLGGIFGNERTYGNGIALDSGNNIYVVGQTGSPYFPTINAFQPVPLAATAFLVKIGSRALPSSSGTPVSTQVGVSTGMLTITLPNISGSTTNSEPALTVEPFSSAATANLNLSNNLGAFDISTTAIFTASTLNPITLCFQALTVNDESTFNGLQLIHIDNGTPVNVTSSRDFPTRTVCGTVTSLSPFVLFSPTTSTVLGASLNPSIFGQSVTFTATIVASGGPPTGTVTFYDGANPLGTQTLDSSGQAILNDTALTAGTHTIIAMYGGDGQLHASTSAGFTETVNKGSTSTLIVASATPSILNEPVRFTTTVSATAPATGTPNGTITFYDGASAIGTATLDAYGQGTLTVSSLGVGAHSISAVYGGNSNFNGSTSSTLTQAVDYEPLGANCLVAAGHQILQPINADGSSVWKQGRTIPVQFRVCDFNGNSVGTAGVVSSFRLTSVIAGTLSNVDETVSSTTTDTAFHWDATNQQWVFNISTKSLSANYTYVYTITLKDGTTISFQYGLK